jgi:hypothetical protein
MQRRWKYWLAAGVVIALVAAAYRPAQQFQRFFAELADRIEMQQVVVEAVLRELARR